MAPKPSKPSKPSKPGRVLADHKQVGKTLIPPLMQLPNMRSFSYADEILPNIIWWAPLFMRLTKRQAIDLSIGFLQTCADALARHDAPPLGHMHNFRKLSEPERESIKQLLHERGQLADLLEQVQHHHLLLEGYPLSFLFEGRLMMPEDRDMYIDMLAEEVAALLDRYSQIATEVQVSIIVSMMATGKLHVRREHISQDDLDAVFKSPDSEGAKRAGSLARAMINCGAGFEEEGGETAWATDFWQQAFKLRGCQ